MLDPKQFKDFKTYSEKLAESSSQYTAGHNTGNIEYDDNGLPKYDQDSNAIGGKNSSMDEQEHDNSQRIPNINYDSNDDPRNEYLNSPDEQQSQESPNN